MVVNINGYGRLGNQLLHFASFIANSVEYDYKLVYYGFELYSIHFPYFEKNNYYIFHRKVSNKVSGRKTINVLAKKLLIYVINFYKNNSTFFPFVNSYDITLDILKLPNIGFSLNDAEFIANARKKVVFVKGWRFIDLENLEKHKSIIKNIFSPSPLVNEYVITRIKYSRKFADIVIGVHIRRTDYKNYMNGQWYYELNVYIKYMELMSNYFKKKNQTVIFIISTDELIDKDFFNGFKIIYEQTNFLIDLYSLTLCDYIIGPPSTFSGWASYYGDVPILYIESDTISKPFHPDLLIKGYHPWHCKSSTKMNLCLVK